LPESLAGAPSAAGRTTFKSTEDTIDKMFDKPDKHRVDQEAMLRARLLDVFLGDWDRHQGQWSFAVTPNADGTKTYRPIARDRDQVFANYDGLGLFLARIASPALRLIQPFDADYGSVAWLTFNARNIDHLLLNQIPRDRWLAIAKQAKDASPMKSSTRRSRPGTRRRTRSTGQELPRPQRSTRQAGRGRR